MIICDMRYFKTENVGPNSKTVPGEGVDGENELKVQVDELIMTRMGRVLYVLNSWRVLSSQCAINTDPSGVLVVWRVSVTIVMVRSNLDTYHLALRAKF